MAKPAKSPAAAAKAPRRRVDALMVERGLAENRARAGAMVMAGLVSAAGKRIDKPGHAVPADAPLAVAARDHPYVSRGGVKLAAALDAFAIDPAGLVCLDIGASTGGFTDVLLRRGAARVYAVDVGHGQLDWRLRNDPRVVVRERVNARSLGREAVPEPVDLVVVDASFIGLATILPAPLALARPGARLVALVKPQFEVEPARVGRGGIVRDPAARAEAVARVGAWLETTAGWRVLGTRESPIAGAEGNVEFLLAARRPPAP
jgi:23S rRNA (cytidine1920-2'-O)/16S rRNA (cytidine1409-2'-O)-methyltransferase